METHSKIKIEIKYLTSELRKKGGKSLKLMKKYYFIS